MAKSKLVKANQKIADSVVSGFGKIQDSVVGTYTKIEDKFVDQYLTKDGESIDDAKKRLKEKKPNYRINRYNHFCKEKQQGFSLLHLRVPAVFMPVLPTRP